MTVEFNCPKCGALIAFDSKHSGKQAKCLTCGQKFIIPDASFQKPEKVAPEPEPKGDPVLDFYRAVFLDSWKLFVNPQNVTPLAFVVAVVCFKFFLVGSCCQSASCGASITGYLRLVSVSRCDSRDGRRPGFHSVTARLPVRPGRRHRRDALHRPLLPPLFLLLQMVRIRNPRLPGEARPLPCGCFATAGY